MPTDTITMPGIQEVVDTSLARTWSLIAHNDDVTPMQLVILAFMKVGLDQKTAVEKTMEIHNTGSAVVQSGLSKDEATQKYNIIVEITKYGGRFPGIEMSFIEDM